jgi:SAM-dependent methyltransferase
MSQQPDWPVAFFDDDYLRIYRPTFTPERTNAEVDFIEQVLGAPRGAAMLDLACGFGRHAIRLAKRGYLVTGVDFSPRYLEIAAEDARAEGVAVTWQAGDMRACRSSARSTPRIRSSPPSVTSATRRTNRCSRASRARSSPAAGS